MARVLQAGTISFGLVNIPIKLCSAASSQNVSFHLMHAKCGNRIKQQQIPICNVVLTRDDLVRGYELAKNQYVQFTEAELEPRALLIPKHRYPGIRAFTKGRFDLFRENLLLGA